MGPLLTAAFFFSAHARAAEPKACERAYEVIERVAHEERKWDYAREVLVEGKKPFVRDCERFLSPAQVRCLLRARSSHELYSCT